MVTDMSGTSGGAELMNFVEEEIHVRTDGAQALYEELTRIETDVVKHKYKPKNGLRIVPIKPDLNMGVKKIKHRYIKGEGEAAIVDGMDPNVPSVNNSVDEREVKVYTLTMGYEIDKDGVARRDLLSLNEAKENAETCQEALWRGIDKMLISGNAKLNAPSLFGGPHAIQTTTLTEGSNILVIKEDIDPDALAQLVIKMSDVLSLNSQDQFNANKLALPNKLRKLLARKRMPDSSISVGQYVAANIEGLKSFDDILGISDFDDNYKGKGQNAPTLSTALAYDMDPAVIRANVLTPRQHFVKKFPFGDFVIWTARTTQALWRQPLGGHAVRFQLDLK